MQQFQGFPEETIQFFLNLRYHNESIWFHSHRQEYEQAVREPFYAFIDAMAPAMSRIADDMELRPARCLARINRDIRFTKDKSPYRDHLWLLFRRQNEEKQDCAMYWFELSPENTVWGLGFWGPNKPAMDVIRDWIDIKPSKVLGAFEAARVPDSSLVIGGRSYVRKPPPKDTAPILQRIYPMKEIYIQRMDTSLKDAYSHDLVQKVSNDFLRLKPLYALFREAADLAKAGLDK